MGLEESNLPLPLWVYRAVALLYSALSPNPDV